MIAVEEPVQESPLGDLRLKYSGRATIALTSNSSVHFMSGIEKIADLARDLREKGEFVPPYDDFVATWKGVMGTRAQFSSNLIHQWEPYLIRLFFPIYDQQDLSNLPRLSKDLRTYWTDSGRPASVRSYNMDKNPVRRLVSNSNSFVIEIDADVAADKGLEQLNRALRNFNGFTVLAAFGARWDVEYRVTNIISPD